MWHQVRIQLAKRKKAIFFAADAAIVAFSVLFGFIMRFEGQVPSAYYIIIARLVLLHWLFYLPSLYFTKLYSFSWSYVGVRELVSLFRATFVSFLLLVTFLFFLREYSFFSGFPRSILFISYFLIFIMSGGIRFAKRLLKNALNGNLISGRQKTVIVGAGDAGEQISRAMLEISSSPYAPVAFADDAPIRQNTIIHGIPVAGPIKEISRIADRYKADAMIIALPSAGSEDIKRAVEIGREAGIRTIKIVPSINELIGGKVTLASVRDIDVADLLARKPVELDTRAISKFIGGKTVLITGAAGSIGSELCRQVIKFEPTEIILLDQDESGIFYIEKELREQKTPSAVSAVVADICDRSKIRKIFSNYRPAVVFHAAAYKHVPLMEDHPDEAVKNNIFGTKTLCEEAVSSGVEKFVFISTDKAINPTSIMGATKRVGEMLCQFYNEKEAAKFVAVRFGNVLGSRGSVIPVFREQIKKGGPVQITHPEMQRYFMLTSEACLLVMQAGAMGKGGEVFVLDMGNPVKILDLAKEMIRLSGFEPDKDIPITYIGLRPGEKMFEEILTAEEGTVATQSEKIFIAKLQRVNDHKILSGLEKLNNGYHAVDAKAIRIALSCLVPNYAAGRLNP